MLWYVFFVLLSLRASWVSADTASLQAYPYVENGKQCLPRQVTVTTTILQYSEGPSQISAGAWPGSNFADPTLGQLHSTNQLDEYASAQFWPINTGTG